MALLACSTIASEPRLAVPSLSGPLTLGGILDEPLWQRGAVLPVGKAICLTDVRGSGETAGADSLAGTELMFGSTLMGQRFKDARAILAAGFPPRSSYTGSTPEWVVAGCRLIAQGSENHV